LIDRVSSRFMCLGIRFAVKDIPRRVRMGYLTDIVGLSERTEEPSETFEEPSKGAVLLQRDFILEEEVLSPPLRAEGWRKGSEKGVFRRS